MHHDQPTVLVSQYQNAANLPVGTNAYKGLRIHALPGLHDFVGRMAAKFFPQGASILDLAAGSGAMCLRMSDLGFRVTATDYVTENFKLTSVPFVQADLNGNFSALFHEKFQAIIASEIVEHLENPRHFARECFALLQPGGHLLITTPNVESPVSKAMFVRSGLFQWFAEEDYVHEGHITPLSHFQMSKVFAEVNFQFLWKGSFGDGMLAAAGSPRLRLLAKCLSLLSSQPASLSGEIFVAILKKPG